MRSTIIRIAIWAFAALLLIVLLVLGINRTALSMDLSGAGFTTTYDFSDSEAYRKEGATLPVGTNISAFELDWIAGEIDIRFYDGDQIRFEETAPRELSENETLRYLVSGEKLTIRFCEPKTGVLRTLKMPEKSLRVLLPKSLAGMDISVHNVSSSVYVDCDQTALRELIVESVSGAVKIIDARVPVLRVSTVSGSLVFKGVSDKADIETISGAVALDFPIIPKQLRTDSVSGSVIVRVMENDGFTATLDSISGRLTCDFAEMAGRKKAVYRNGRAGFAFHTISGSVTIAWLQGTPLSNGTNGKNEAIEENELPVAEPGPSLDLPAAEPKLPPGPQERVPVPSSGRKF